MSSDVLAPPASGYRTAPSQTDTRFPSGVPYIIGNEAAERFSFYGMKSILALFMAKYLVSRTGAPDHMSDNEAEQYTHYFVAGVYYLPVVGALISDGVWGKYRTILWLSIVYCFGHFALALNDTRWGLAVGLALICVGAGGIKPCVSANVGDQFGEGNKHLLTKVFGWFYFSINAGSFISTLLCPFLLEDPRFGPHWAFGIPGVAMVIATFCFWLGRRRFVHVPPAGLGFLRVAFGREGRTVLLRLVSVYVFIIIFWALWDQSSGVEWTLQAERMNLFVSWLPWISVQFWPFHFGAGWGLALSAGQVQTANAILILIYIPLVNYVIYPAISRVFPLTALRKIGLGLFITAASFVVIAYIQKMIDAGLKPSVNWQLLAYAILTLAEAMVSITGLEFSYTQSPNSMKSAVMALWLFAVATGNILIAQFHAWNELKPDFSKITYLPSFDIGSTAVWVNILRPDATKITNLQFFNACTLVMFGAACVFVVVAYFYQGRTYLQGNDDARLAEADIAATTQMPA